MRPDAEFLLEQRFGNPRADGTAGAVTSVTNPVQFAGAYQDSTLGGQYSPLALVYDPGTGRFGAVDPASPSLRPRRSPGMC